MRNLASASMLRRSVSGHFSRVLAIAVYQVEDHQQRLKSAAFDQRGMQGEEVGQAILPAHDGFTIDDRGSDLQARERFGDAWHPCRPVEPSPSEDARLAVLDARYGAIAVELPLMKPVRP